MNKEWYEKIRQKNDYRAYVGPYHLYDIMGLIQFQLLLQLGMTDEDNVLDVGCGSLRAGRWIIMQCKKYVGVEPEQWLIKESDIAKEVLEKLKPIFYKSIDDIKKEIKFDFVMMHSILSHMPINMFQDYLRKLKPFLKSSSKVIVTYVPGENYIGSEWVYPGHITYRLDFLKNICKNEMYTCTQFDWPHTTQKWFILESLPC